MNCSECIQIDKLQQGTQFTIYNIHGISNTAFFYICPKLQSLCCNTSKRTFENAANEFPLKDCEVRSGFKTDIWVKAYTSKKINEQKKDLAFSILHNRGRKCFDLLANDKETRDMWTHGLQVLIQRNIGKPYTKITNKWLEGLFNEADRDRNGLLCKREVHQLLERLNVRLTSDEFERYFQQTDLSTAKCRGQLRVDEFIKFYQMLTYRPELMHIIHTYSEACELCVCNENSTIALICTKLMPQTSNQSITSMNCSSGKLNPMIAAPPSSLCSLNSNYMTIEELKEFMINEQNENLSLDQITELVKKYDPSTEGKECIEMGVDGLREMLLNDDNQLMKPKHQNTVYQDMTKPLTDYWINTSHNTYLSASQLVGSCTGESYVQALKQGCRSVELDLHDGPNEYPVVRHGYTLIKHANLHDILIQIKTFSFSISPYPLFLNIENHCSQKQQITVAKLLTDVFGSSIYTADEANSHSIWPSPEQLKGRIIIRSRVTSKNDISMDCNNDDESADSNIPIVCKELLSLIACQNTTFKGFSISKNYKHTQSSSVSEKKALTLLENNALDSILINQQSITRVYPSLYRHDSSNVDVVTFWNIGVQMVALNFQTGDASMSLNHGRFTDNNQCGYILKPIILRDRSTTFRPNSSYTTYIFAQRKPIKLHFCIISAQHLPKRNQRDSSPVSPFVKVKIYGVRCDQNEQKTSTVLTNGLNPIWNHLMEFSIYIPELCHIRFTVKDSDKNSTDLGQYSLPFLSMQTGYRHIRLLDEHNLPTTATLFLNVKIINND